jgi:hypothetical protein
VRFVKQSRIRASAATVFGFHERPDAFRLLQPPWQPAEIVLPPTSLEVGTRVIIRVKLGPVWQTIESVHVAHEPGRSFTDRMVRGPFARWEHEHVVTPDGEAHSVLTDRIEYELPLGALGKLAGGWFAKRSLERLFDYRHDVTRRICEAGQPFDGDPLGGTT